MCFLVSCLVPQGHETWVFVWVIILLVLCGSLGVTSPIFSSVNALSPVLVYLSSICLIFSMKCLVGRYGGAGLEKPEPGMLSGSPRWLGLWSEESPAAPTALPQAPPLSSRGPLNRQVMTGSREMGLLFIVATLERETTKMVQRHLSPSPSGSWHEV